MEGHSAECNFQFEQKQLHRHNHAAEPAVCVGCTASANTAEEPTGEESSQMPFLPDSYGYYLRIENLTAIS